jgi:hypothetical protein
MTRTTARVALNLATRAVLVFALACSGDRAPIGPLRVTFQRVETRPDLGAVSIAPLDTKNLETLDRARPSVEEWQKIFSVYAGDSIGLPMLGTYSISNDTLRFVPRFPPIRGTRYTARFNGGAFNAKTGATLPAIVSDAVWTREAPAGAPTTSVEEVYPTADSVPMNLLRIYVQFSAPMTVNDRVNDHIRLVDETGVAVDKAFLIPTGDQELWDPAHTRLTLFLDPGRIKRDLVPHDALGLPIRDGHSYTLTIDSTLRDAVGLALTHPFTKHFRVGPIDRTLPRTPTWRIGMPKAGTTDPLAIDFPEPLDHALVQRMLTVKRASGNGNDISLSGRVTTSDHDRRWTFTPDKPWEKSAYYVNVDTELEDLAGNNLKHLFDVMPGDSASRGVDGSTTRIPFRPI